MFLSFRPRRAQSVQPKQSLARSFFRPRLEELEQRLAPATHTWTGTAGTLWPNANNWTGGAPAPGEADVILHVSGGINPSNTNDIAGLTVRSILFSANGFSLSGNDITLTN